MTLRASTAMLHPALARLVEWHAIHGVDIRGAFAVDPSGLPDHRTLNDWADAVHDPALPRRRFVPCERAMSALAYEERIARAGEIVTRAQSAHDVCNALAWLAWPRTKAALNRLHCTPWPACDGRGRVRDTATLLDEFGVVVLACNPSLVARWQRHEWREAFHERRVEVERTMRIGVLGHGLMHALIAPFPALTAKALVIAVPEGLPDENDLAMLDRAAARWLESAGATLHPHALLPLPVIAWPGWNPRSSGPERFDDARIFRPARPARAPLPGACETSPNTSAVD